jgi:cytoskeleton protein RodZ
MAEVTSFGDLLREGRERRGLTLEALARTTRVPEATLRALESGALDGLPPEVYTKGFIRSISRTVGISEAGPLESYQKALAQQRQVAAAASSEAEALARPSRRRRQQMALVAAAVVVLMALLVLVLRGS